jgi:hypothetical protein
MWDSYHGRNDMTRWVGALQERRIYDTRLPSQYGTTGSSSPSRGLRFELRHQKRRAKW